MSYELLDYELGYILERNNISKRKLLIEAILEAKEKVDNEKLSESTRLVYALHYARCYAIFKQLYPYYEKMIDKKIN